MMMTVIGVIIKHVYINRCFSFKVGWPNCKEHIQVDFSPLIYWLIPLTVRTHSLLLQSEPHVNRNQSHRRVLTMVSSSRENHIGSCSEPSMPKSQNPTKQAGNQEQYLFFHMMTVQLTESSTAIIRQQRIFCVRAEMALSSHGYWAQRTNRSVHNDIALIEWHCSS